MPVAGIDHVALPTADGERLLAFYLALGFTETEAEAWRAGKYPIFSIACGNNKINVHPEGFTADLRGPTAVPGCGDLCFVWQGGLESLQKTLADAGVAVIHGPVDRVGGRSAGIGSRRERLRPRPRRQPGRVHLLRRAGGGPDLLMAPASSTGDLVVAHLGEVVVEGADGPEGRRETEADEVVGDAGHRARRVRGSHRDGEHDPEGSQVPHHLDGGPGGVPRRQAVVDHDDGPAAAPAAASAHP